MTARSVSCSSFANSTDGDIYVSLRQFKSQAAVTQVEFCVSEICALGIPKIRLSRFAHNGFHRNCSVKTKLLYPFSQVQVMQHNIPIHSYT